MTPTGETSLLLWVMAAVVVLFASHLFIAWVRRAQGTEGWRHTLGPAALGGAAMGLGMSCAMVLAMSAEALPFPLGYRWIAVPGLVLAPMVLCIPAAWWLVRRQNWLALLGAGLLLALVALAVQVGWIISAGLRPGIRWNFPLLGAAGGLQVMGFVAALWLAYSDASSEGARKTLWRVGAAALVMLTLISGQEVVVASIGLLSQVGSIYQREASSTWLCLVAGALVPIVLAILSLDVWLRNRGERRRSRNGIELNLPKRRKRRRKYRAL
jgi:NO-binding membrane sensor protein with MHYT domain